MKGVSCCHKGETDVANPIRFETIEKKNGLESGTLERLSAEAGFPVAGAGVAIEADVLLWLKNRQGLMPESSSTGSGAESNPLDPELPPVEVEEVAGVVWLVIRVPVLMDAPAVPGANPAPSFRISHREQHLKKAWGAIHHGCRAVKAEMRGGSKVARVSHSLKFLLEQVAIAMKMD